MVKTKDKIENLKEKISDKVEDTKEKMLEYEDSIILYVQQNPLKSLGMAIGAGVLIGAGVSMGKDYAMRQRIRRHSILHKYFGF